jgi:hypothetical protein
VKEFRVVVIRPDATGGVTTQLQAALEVNDEGNFELHTLVPFRDGLLAVFVRDLEAEEVG